jgi:prophage regulatory protein
MPRFLAFDDLRPKGITWTRMHLDRLEKSGRFPKRVHLSNRSVVWVESEVDAFLAEKLAERNVSPAAA